MRRAAETGDGPGLAIVGHGRVPGLDRLGVGRASSGLAITLIGHGTAGMAGRSEGTLVAAPQPLIVVGGAAGFAPFIGDEHVAGRVRARASHRHDPPGDDAWSRAAGIHLETVGPRAKRTHPGDSAAPRYAHGSCYETVPARGGAPRSSSASQENEKRECIAQAGADVLPTTRRRR